MFLVIHSPGDCYECAGTDTPLGAFETADQARAEIVRLFGLRDRVEVAPGKWQERPTFSSMDLDVLEVPLGRTDARPKEVPYKARPSTAFDGLLLDFARFDLDLKSGLETDSIGPVTLLYNPPGAPR